MYERSLEQNLQRLELEKWEQQLYEREMHIVELELRLLMATNHQERVQNPTPKIQKRSGRFMRSLLNGSHNHATQSSTKLISSPTSKHSRERETGFLLCFFILKITKISGI